MIEIKELRIGNIAFHKKQKKALVVSGIRADGVIYTYNDEQDIYENYIADDIEPILLKDSLLRTLDNENILDYDRSSTKKKLIYFFGGKSRVYFIVNDREIGGFFIGMTDIAHESGYRRLSQTFGSYHQLQNAYYTVYLHEIKNLSIEKYK